MVHPQTVRVSRAAAVLVVTACAHRSVAPATTPVAEVASAARAGEAAVRAERARFNVRIAARDTAGMSAVFLPTYVLISGRSAQTRGDRAAVDGWATIFRTDPIATYVRMPREVRVNDAWGMAEELGDWTGRLTAGGVALRVAGRYAAKWQRGRGGQWRLQSEVFTTFACGAEAAACAALAPADL